MKHYSVIGIKRREFRGNFQPMVITAMVDAESEEEARKKFEDDNPQYLGQDIEAGPEVRTGKPKKEKVVE